jgi:(2R)-3-sulfolactate dehydrogenase (NADP+)
MEYTFMHTLAHLQDLCQRALIQGGASPDAARATTEALLYAESQGTASHGLSRVSQYVGHMQSGRIKGQAVPSIAHEKAAVALIDAADGLAFPACELAIATGITKAKAAGVAFVAINNSYHAGAAIYHLEAAAKAGLVGLAMTNSPSAIAAWGGAKPLFGTNPIAAIFPRHQAQPIAIDLALSEVARGKIMVAAKANKPIPIGWAKDAQGQDTTDAQAGLKGSMAPMGGVKGVMLALMVELLVTALTGARLGFEVDSFFDKTGNAPRIGQAFLLIDPAALAGNAVYNERVEALLAMMPCKPTPTAKVSPSATRFTPS